MLYNIGKATEIETLPAYKHWQRELFWEMNNVLHRLALEITT